MHSIVIAHYPDRLVFRNPGSLLVSVEQYFEGGTSICRNSILQKMFEFIGEGERAGSGVDTIKKGWKDNGWAEPVVREIEEPEQVELILPLGSLGSGVDYQETTKTTTKTTTKSTTKTPLGPTAQSIVDLLKAEPDLNASQIAEKLSLRIDNTRFHIRSLKKKGILIHVGPDNNGHWEVVDRQ